MIHSFQHKGLEAFFRSGSKAGIRPDHAQRLQLQLGSLDQATEGAEPRLRNPSLGLVAGLSSRLQYESAETLLGQGLHEYLSEARSTLATVSQRLAEGFFGSTPSAA